MNQHSNTWLILGLAGIFVLFLVLLTAFVMMNKGSVGTSDEDGVLKTYRSQYTDLGGEDSFFVALQRAGDGSGAGDHQIYDREFMQVLLYVTDDVFFLPGIDRSTVLSLFTPHTRMDPSTGRGIPGTQVIPNDYQPTDEVLRQVGERVVRIGLEGELVSQDHRGARVVAKWMPKDPISGIALKPRVVADALAAICLKFSSPAIVVTGVMRVGEKYWIIGPEGITDRVWADSN
jgi:hypothetical protein